MQEIEITPSARLARLRHAFVAPGPRPPADGIPRPKLQFEPSHIRGDKPPESRATTAAHAAGKDTTGRAR